MKTSLRVKTVLAFFLAAAVGFIVLVVFWTLSEKQQEASTVRMLNQKVNMLASSSLLTDQSAQKTLNISASSLNASIWVTDVKGQVLLSAGKYAGPKSIPNFNTDFATSNYLSGRFFDQFESDVLTVFSPVSTDV